MDTVRIGIVGYGGMGSNHASYISRGDIDGAQLTAVADIDPAALERAEKTFGDKVRRFKSAEELFAAKCVDAIMIATPHYDHPPIGIGGFKQGLHVLSEKPAGVYTNQVKAFNKAADESGKIFGVMFNQRTLPVHQKLKEMLDSQELGPLKRNTWLITSWYRPQSYYDSGGWRATWAGEGGGVLLNQCPHNLDLWQWFVGMPRRVRAFCGFGKYHDIEVEDDVTAYVEYEDGSTGLFVTSTGEAPGTNRFEISGDRGKIILEGGQLSFYRTRISEREFNATYTGGFGSPEIWKCDIPVTGRSVQQHMAVTQAWVNAIRHDDPSMLIADGREGIKELEISNAMLMSAWIDDWVELPIDGEHYQKLLEERVEKSTYEKKTAGKTLDVKDSF